MKHTEPTEGLPKSQRRLTQGSTEVLPKSQRRLTQGSTEVLPKSQPKAYSRGSQRLTQGSCLCKSVVFEIEGEFEDFYLCHCSRCRKDTGAAHAANLFSSTAKITWLSGEELVKTYRVAGTQHTKSFCPHCGSALPTLQMEGSLLVVPAGSLDTDPRISPRAHIFVDSRASWDNNLENLPRYPQQPVSTENN